MRNTKYHTPEAYWSQLQYFIDFDGWKRQSNVYVPSHHMPKGNQIILCVWFCHISDVLAQMCELALTDWVRNISSIIHVVLIRSQKQNIHIAVVLLATIHIMGLILVEEKYYFIFQLLMILQKKKLNRLLLPWDCFTYFLLLYSFIEYFHSHYLIKIDSLWRSHLSKSINCLDIYCG